MKNKMMSFIVIGLMVAMASSAHAFSFGDMWSGLKEKIGLGETVREQAQDQDRQQSSQIVPANAGVDSNGRVDTSKMKSGQSNGLGQTVSTMAQNKTKSQVQAQARERVRLAKKAGIVGKIALMGKDKECEAWGGTWYWDDDIVGCQGVDGSYSCDVFMVQRAKAMCEDQAATFVCDTSGIYCTYT